MEIEDAESRARNAKYDAFLERYFDERYSLSKDGIDQKS